MCYKILSDIYKYMIVINKYDICELCQWKLVLFGS